MPYAGHRQIRASGNHHAPAAFTLVELLVVAAIIALLIAILVPALAGAKQYANRVKCQTQLRQIQTGVLLFYHENGSRYPSLVPSEVLPYLSGSIQLFHCPSNDLAWQSFANCYNYLGTPPSAELGLSQEYVSLTDIQFPHALGGGKFAMNEVFGDGHTEYVVSP